MKLTEQEIEKLARKAWQDLHEKAGAWRSPTGNEWEYYLQAWKDAISVMYTEEDMRMCWQQGYSNGFLYDIDDDIAGPRPDYSQWVKQLKQEKQQRS